MATCGYLDPFGAKNPWKGLPGTPLFSTISSLPYAYTPFDGCWADNYMAQTKYQHRRGFVMHSAGPDRQMTYPEYGFIDYRSPPGGYIIVPFGSENSFSWCWSTIYDTTNGTISGGDIPRIGGDLQSPPPM